MKEDREKRAMELLQQMGELDPEDVLKAAPGAYRPQRRRWSSVAVAAALLLICGSAVVMVSLPMDGGQTGGQTSGMPTVSSSGETGAAGSSAEGSSASFTLTVQLLDETAFEEGETDLTALLTGSATLTVDGDTGSVEGESFTLPEGVPLEDGLIFAPRWQLFLAQSGGYYQLYPVSPEDWPELESGSSYSWSEAVEILQNH